MYLKALFLHGFRNFENLSVPLNPRVNYFVGNNGQGKTNFIESIYLIANGRSFRPAERENFLLKSEIQVAQNSRISTNLIRKGLDFRIEYTLNEEKSSLVINSKKSNLSQVQKLMPVVLFSPESLAAIKEGPEQRRVLLDEILVLQNSSAGNLLREFNRCFRSRNRLLRDIRECKNDPTQLRLTLESINKIYLLLSTQLTHLRLKALHAILNDFRASMEFISDGEIGDISVDYVISQQSAINWSEQEVFAALCNRSRELMNQEIAAGRSLVGPHKHDIKILVSGNDSRFYCSQGQQRALILSLKIAQIVYHYKVHQIYPLLLLDDVLSELDQGKRRNLLKFLEGISAQIFITTTDFEWSEKFDPNCHSMFNVSRGSMDRLFVEQQSSLERVLR